MLTEAEMDSLIDDLRRACTVSISTDEHDARIVALKFVKVVTKNFLDECAAERAEGQKQ